MFFEEKETYETSLSATEVQARIQTLITTGSQYGDKFWGKVKPTSFILHPILGMKRGWKLSMVGEVLTENTTKVNVTYKIDMPLYVLLYAAIIFNTVIFFVLMFTSLSETLLGFKGAQYIQLACIVFTIIILKLIFNEQYAQYSKLIAEVIGS